MRSFVVLAALVLAAAPAFGKCAEPDLHFLPTVGIPVPESVATADFDKDGHLDLAMTVTPNGEIRILFGNGDGTFRTTDAPTYAANAHAYGVQVADMNGDAWPDLVTFAGNDVAVLLNAGDGTFGAPILTSPQLAPSRFATGDLDGDGRTDVAVGGFSGTLWINVFYGTGDGHFRETFTTLATNGAPKGIAIADFDGDGKLDVADSADKNSAVQLEVWHNTLPGGFTRTTYAVPNATSSGQIAAVDLAGDGRLDIALLAASSVVSFLGDGHGAFTFGAATAANSDHSTMAIADFTEDGKADILLPGFLSYFGQYLVCDGAGGFTAVQSSQLYENFLAPLAGDFDANGRTDVIMLNPAYNVFQVALNACEPRFVKVIATPSAQPSLYGDAVTFTITVTPRASSLPTPTGMVTIRGLVATLAPVGGSSNAAKASLTIGGLVLGENEITIDYSGDATYGSTSITTAQTVVRRPFSVPAEFFAGGFPADGGQPGGVYLRWVASAGVDHHEIWRLDGGVWSLLTTTPNETFIDPNVLETKTYGYRIRSVAADHSVTPYTYTAVGTSAPLFANETTGAVILASDIADVRRLANQLRATAGLAPATFTDPSLVGTLIKAIHIHELRTAIDAARAALALPHWNYIRPINGGGVQLVLPNDVGDVFNAAHQR